MIQEENRISMGELFAFGLMFQIQRRFKFKQREFKRETCSP